MGLNQNTINALTAADVRWINFKFANRLISPIGYYLIASQVYSGAIKVAQNSNVADGAQYDPANNTIIVKDASFGDTYWDEKATLVHEGTHAILDRFYPGRDVNGKSSTMTVLTDETIAYLAGAIFMIAAGQAGTAKSGSPHYAATQVAKPKVEASKKRGWDGCYTMDFTATEVAPLQTVIKAHPNYSNWAQIALQDG